MSSSPSSDAISVDPAPRRHDYDAVFCGGGPAATGMLVCAAQDGRLEELLERGVFVIEKGPSLATGSIGHYRIVGNTPASSFVGLLANSSSHGLFEALAADPATEELVRQGRGYPQLHQVAPYLERLGESLRDLLQGHPVSGVVLNTAVWGVRLLADGGVRVTASPVDDAARAFSVTARRAVIAMGGCVPPGLETLSLLPGLTLADHEHKLCHASALIDNRLGAPPQLVEAVRETRSAAVVGGSHSAWSAAWLLVNDPAFRGADGRPPRVTVLHRGPLLFFYDSVTDARADRYAFDEVHNVCSSSGNVYRYAGLRAPDTRALALAAVGPQRGQSPVRGIRLVDEPDVRSEVDRTLEEAAMIVAGVGYHAHLPELTWTDGSPLEPAVSETGLVTTPDAALVTADGTVVPEIVAYGLGAGLTAVSGLACEPSYRGRFDAVRLYQGEVGRVALRAVLSDRAAPTRRT